MGFCRGVIACGGTRSTATCKQTARTGSNSVPTRQRPLPGRKFGQTRPSVLFRASPEGFDPKDFEPKQKVETLSTRLGGKDDSYTAWPDRIPLLRKSQIPSISQEEVILRMETGEAVLLDIREESQFAELHAAGAVNVPLFVPSGESSDYDRLRKFAYRLVPALSGRPPTDWNPDFAEEAVAAADGEDTTIMVMCDRGGSIASRPGGFTNGIESRSWIALHELLVAGVPPSRLLHVKGGFLQWQERGFDCEYYVYEEA